MSYFACGDRGRFANAGNLLSQCERFHLPRVEAEAFIEAMEGDRSRDLGMMRCVAKGSPSETAAC
jgi:hypothetical protein